jgi:acyl-CoA synthetase (AMP-forming)/AMP-acid ligase II
MDDSEVDSLSSIFERVSENNPDKVALYLPERPHFFSAKVHKKYTYKELGEASDRMAFALERAGVERKMRAVLLLNPGFELFAMVIAMFKIGVVPVFLNPRIGLKQLAKCIQEVKPDIFIGNTISFMIKPFLGLEKDSIKINIVGGVKFAAGAISLKALNAEAAPKKKYHSNPLEPEDQAAIMFTSGGTGRPKGVIYTYRNLLIQFKVIRKTYDIGSDLLDMPTLIFFSFFDLSRGLSVVVPDTRLIRPASVDPKMILDIINKFEVTPAPAPCSSPRRRRSAPTGGPPN